MRTNSVPWLAVAMVTVLAAGFVLSTPAEARRDGMSIQTGRATMPSQGSRARRNDVISPDCRYVCKDAACTEFVMRCTPVKR